MCGELYEAISEENNERVALKISKTVYFNYIKQNHIKHVYEDPCKEAALLYKIRNDAKKNNIVYLHKSFKIKYFFEYSNTYEDAIVQVMDFLPGQTVLDFVNQELLDHRYSTVAYVDSAERRDIVYQMANILAYFHHNNYVHLDFTLENLMFNELNQVVVIDLGLSQYCPESFNVSIYSGKRIYLPPETYVPQTSFDGTKRDIWSLGVCIYTLYSGNYFLIGNETIQQACKSLKYGFDYYLQSHYPLGLKWPKQLKSIFF